MSSRTDAFTTTELRCLVASLRKHDARELLEEFEIALAERIRLQSEILRAGTGVVDAPKGRDPA